MRVGRNHLALLAAVSGVTGFGLRASADVLATRVGPNGNTYKVLAQPDGGGGFNGMTWATAEAEAVTLGGHLTTINTAAEQDWVYRTFSPYRTDLWIGLNAVASPGNFVWSSGQPVTYTNWSSANGEPNPDPNAKYVHQWWATAGKWRAGFAGDNLFGVAEIETSAGVFNWLPAAGGVFGSGGNWSPAGPPPAAGVARFDLNDPYTVSFTGGASNAAATIEQGGVTFNLAGNTYALSDLYVGESSGKSASLTLAGSGAGKIQSSTTTIGDAAGGSGTLVVTAGASLVNATDLFVANAGSGSLNIPAGGKVSTARMYLGNLAGASGTVTLSGIGSTFTGTGTTYVGWLGTGTLTVNQGAKMTLAGLEIAEWENTSATVVLDGSGSSIDTTANVGVGLRGSGALTISGGAKLHALISASTLGQWGTNASGTALVTGTGSSWTSDYGINIGNDGRGVLSVENGGSVVAHDITIAAGSFSSGDVTVTGPGSHLGLIDNGGFSVGANGFGSLTVTNHGDVTSSDITAGDGPTGVGQIAVTGAGSQLRLQGGIRPGVWGSGLLGVSAGGTVAASWMLLGDQANSYGAASIDGPGSNVTLSGGELLVANQGTGVLAISNSAVVTVSNNETRIGIEAGSAGAVTVTGAGSKLTTAYDLLVGQIGSGSLIVRDGAAVRSQFSALRIANDMGSQGLVDVSGPGSLVQVADRVQVGRSGVGTLLIGPGAVVTGGECGVIADDTSTGGAGYVHVDGGVWQVPAWISVGEQGTNTAAFGGFSAVLEIVNGGRVTSGTEGYIAWGPGTVAKALVSGAGSQWEIGNQLFVGSSGNARLTIEKGATVSNTWSRIGADTGGVGAVTVTGPGSMWTCSQDLIIGEWGNGALSVLDGGQVSSAGDTQIGPNGGVSGSLSVSGAGSKYTIANGVLNAWRGGVMVADGGTIEIPNAYMYLANEATLTLAGGTINARDGFWSEDSPAPVSGFGTINGWARGRFNTIAHNGRLVIGDPTRIDGFGVEGSATVEDNATLELLDKDYAGFYGPHAVTLTNGVIIARNGLHIDLDPNGLMGYGVVVGPCDRTISAPTGRVNMTQTLDIGASVARVYSAGIADLGMLTTISGGQLNAPAGVRFGADDLLAGFGTVAANVSLQNGIVAADTGKTMTIAGSLSGYGVLVGNVSPFINSITSPTGTVALTKGVDIANRAAKVYSLPGASLGTMTTLAGGSITAANGLTVGANQQLAGHGTINANIALAGGMLRGDAGTLTISGTVSGYGLLANNIAPTTLLPASAPVNFASPMDLGGDTVTIYSSAPSSLSSTLTLNATSLICGQGVNITPAGLLRGEGVVSGPVTNNGEIRSTTGSIVFSGPVQGSGKIGGNTIGFGAGGSFTGGGAISARVFSDPGSTITATADLTLGTVDNPGGAALNDGSQLGTPQMTGGVSWVALGGDLNVGSHTVTLQGMSAASLSGTTAINGGVLSSPPGLYNTGVIVMTGSNSTLSTSSLVNSGTIQGHGTFRSTSSIDNGNVMTLSGVCDLVGQVHNGGQITVTGGGPTTFYNTVENNGDIKVSAASTAVFLDSVSGFGTFSGTGTKLFEGGSSALAAVVSPGSTVVQPAASVTADVFREKSLTVRGDVTINPDGGSDGTSVLNQLQIDLGGCLDLKDNDVVLLNGNYAAVRQWIRTNALATTAATPSPLYPAALAPVDNNLLHAIDWNGLSISDGSMFDQVMVKYTYLGDVNLDGQVTDADLYNLIANMGRAGTWFQGDVDLDGMVTVTDFNIVSQHLGAGVAALGGGTPLLSSYTVVPEPGAIGLIVAAGLCLLRRARRK